MTEEKKKMSKGCLVALIVAGSLVVLVIGAALFTYIYWDQLLEWGLEKTTDMIALEIKANLPSDVSEQDVDDLFDKFREAIKEKKVKAAKAQELATLFKTMYEDQKIDSSEARVLINEIKEMVNN